MRLRDRTAVVTGASMGIGAATAVALARRGVTVWAVARDRDRLHAVAGKNPSIHPIVADLSVSADRERLVDAVVGPVDILINNAGLAIQEPLESSTPTQVMQMIDLNVTALIDLSRRLLPGMLERRNGHICNIGSSVSHVAIPNMAVYSATKFAVEGFTDALRREVAFRGVTVSLIQPGPVKTGFWDRATLGDRPDVANESGAGMPASWVANAIVRAIRFDRVPGYQTVAVPRPVGLARILDVPIISYGVDLVCEVMARRSSTTDRR